MNSIEDLKVAVQAGQKAYWKNVGYEVRQSRDGEWIIVCFNGFITPLTEKHDPADFFTETP